ncbi:hypothetical protein [Bradyrhizobium acaciae]|uniref:hypothetical protein n=1 Tax=Bradyrhizobium acaciae TaxID=2683706 RepID=UPI001E538943|nr:hypothetical protein [Bradyrhizobium acaciae]MCC8978183.1 hypothetical protein [Bradyrhizobium acaciae]
MARRLIFIMVALTLTGLCACATAPWVIYWYGLRQIEGRPTPAVHNATAEQLDRLFKKLKITQPVQIDPLSPYTPFLQGAHPNSSTRLAWIIARSHNVSHLGDHHGMLVWHLSGMALTIWLTRNWTQTELIAKAVELEEPIAASTAP